MIHKFSSNDLMETFYNKWLDHSTELDTRFIKLHRTLTKRSEQVREYLQALQRYTEDSIELSNWLQKKEEEFTSLKQQYQHSLHLESLHFVDKCQV